MRISDLRGGLKISAFVISLVWAGAAGCSGQDEVTSQPEPSRSRDATLSDFDKLYLTRRPALGALHVIDVAGESFERKVLAATLQGLVNRSEARVYLIHEEPKEVASWKSDDKRDAALFWLEHYREQYGVTKAWEGDLSEAVSLFASEINGYYLVSESEPWTINAATTFASQRGALVAFEAERDLLESAGIGLIESLLGRWGNAAECYLELEQISRSKMDSRALAMLNPDDDRLRDFLIQQGIMAVYSRPFLDDWDSIGGIVERTPANTPVYGYLSDTGAEEFAAVRALSESSKFLIPSDTTPNLSFHVAVVPEVMPTARPLRDPTSTPPAKNCSQGEVNVAIAITDGDNLALPLRRTIQLHSWRSNERGSLPMGWGFSSALPVLAPAVAAYYLSSASNVDEWVAMLGIGYALPTYYSDRDFFLPKSFEKMRETGLSTFWALDIPLYEESAPTWPDFTSKASPGTPAGVLLGYIGSGKARSFRTAEGLPVLVAANQYDDTPERIAERIRQVVTQPPSERPPVLFISAHVSYQGMVDELLPLEEDGVHFLLPSEAFACVP